MASPTYSNSAGPRDWTGQAGASGGDGHEPPSSVPNLYPAVNPQQTGQIGPFGPPWFLAGGTGVFVEAGSAGFAQVKRFLAGATGVYVLTGNAGFGVLKKFLAGGTGAFVLAGNAGIAEIKRFLSGGTGVYLLTGGDGNFKLVLGSGLPVRQTPDEVSGRARAGGWSPGHVKETIFERAYRERQELLARQRLAKQLLVKRHEITLGEIGELGEKLGGLEAALALREQHLAALEADDEEALLYIISAAL